jgi:histidinol-phosphatase (PHP family)
MTMPSDYHMHTYLCRHATGKPVDYAAQALEIGLTEIGFSDHSPMRDDHFDNWRMYMSQLDLYVSMVEDARRAYPQLRIRLALEVDYLPGGEDWIRHLAAKYPWDYLIGSVHYVDKDWDVDNPTKLSEWDKHDPYEVWSMYFERLTQAAASGLFNIMGHVDLPKKFNRRPVQDCTPLLDTFLAAARKQGCAVEINTAGLRKDCQEFYPSAAWLQRICQAGIPLTFGSDAHAAEEVGMNFAEAVQMAKTVGYTHYATFAGRQMTLVSL